MLSTLAAINLPFFWGCKLNPTHKKGDFWGMVVMTDLQKPQKWPAWLAFYRVSLACHDCATCENEDGVEAMGEDHPT